MSVKIIADSTCDLPADLLAQYDITILPLSINKGGQFYKDGIEITPSDIFAHVDAGGALCSTAAVNIDEFMNCFAKYSDQYDLSLGETLGVGLSPAPVQRAKITRDDKEPHNSLLRDSFPGVFYCSPKNNRNKNHICRLVGFHLASLRTCLR